MTIKYPVRVSLTDETLIVDQDNTSIATTFFGKEDYDAEYERRALDAAIIVECLNKRKILTELATENAELAARVKELEGALDEAQKALAVFIAPDAIENTSVLSAYATAVKAEAKARSALANKEGSA